MMYIVLKDGTKVSAPPASKSMLGFNAFLDLAKLEGSTLVMLDLECTYESILKRQQMFFRKCD